MKLIDSKKEGLNFRVGDDGSKLSGGQIQRLGIARALFKNSELLILDESTSSLDLATEELILKTLSGFKKTIIIISHKLNTLKNCDKIYEIKDKQIKEIKNIEIQKLNYE